MARERFSLRAILFFVVLSSWSLVFVAGATLSADQVAMGDMPHDKHAKHSNKQPSPSKSQRSQQQHFNNSDVIASQDLDVPRQVRIKHSVTSHSVQNLISDIFLQKNIEQSRRKPQFVAVTKLEDAQAIRAVAMHPTRNVYALGSNTKTLRLCQFPDLENLR